MVSMLNHQFLPALNNFATSLANSINAKMTAAGISSVAENKLLKKACTAYDTIYERVAKLVNDTTYAESIEDMLEAANYYHDVILADMESVRSVADAIEHLIPEQFLPYPSYEKLLFSV